MKILIIAYDWPPRNSIACHRPYAWAKYWSERGARVVVITAQKQSFDEPLDLDLPQLSGVDVREVSYRSKVPLISHAKNRNTNFFTEKLQHKVIAILKKFKFTISKIIGINFDIRDRWGVEAIPIANDVINSEGINIVVSTFGPRSCHVIASKLKQNYPKLKWVADYRDLWSKNHAVEFTEKQRKKEENLERETLMLADMVTTVSPPLAESLEILLKRKVDVVYNGFDFLWSDVVNNFSSRKNISSDKVIRIVYTGMIYPRRQDPDLLFCAINEMILSGEIENSKIEVHFYGGRQFGLKKIVESNKANGYVFIHGHVRREVALQAQRDANLLLILESGGDDSRGVLTGKIFEYLVSGVPILSLGSSVESEIAKLINACSVGIVAGNNIEKIKFALRSTLGLIDSNYYKPNLDVVKNFSRKLQSNRFFDQIKILTN